MTHRVLLGESSRFMRQLFHKTLEPLAMNIVGEAATQADLFTAFETHGPDLVIIDVSIGGGGAEAAQHLLDTHPEAKIILCASQSRLPEARAAQAWGVREVLQKPFHPEKLQEMAIQVLMS
ncbi:MAG: response regulator [Candidatus Sericytochromatia bacterium]|nr:response regulator [Candidatus Sericytochromatia bacterium]